MSDFDPNDFTMVALSQHGVMVSIEYDADADDYRIEIGYGGDTLSFLDEVKIFALRNMLNVLRPDGDDEEATR